MKHALFVLTVAISGAAPAFAAGNAQAPTDGAHLAQTVCAECHAVGADANAHSPNPQAPRFVDVAAMPSTTALSIKVFLRSSHKDMPNLMLDETESDTIASYILGLRKK